MNAERPHYPAGINVRTDGTEGVERVSVGDLYEIFGKWQTIAEGDDSTHAARPNWEDMLARISLESSQKLRSTEQSAYEAVCCDLPEIRRIDLARYVVMLKLLGDITYSRPEWIRPAAAEGLKALVCGVNQRMAVYRGAAASFEQLWVPDDARDAHHRLVRALRDHAAIDRRAAAELREYGNLDRYSSGENETKSFLMAINQAVPEIVSAMQKFVKQGILLQLLTKP
jgi:hypothetical protein